MRRSFRDILIAERNYARTRRVLGCGVKGRIRPQLFLISLLIVLNNGDSLVLTFDIETKKTIEEVGGRDNIREMGVGCLVVLDSNDFNYHVFSPDNVPGAKSLDCVIELFDTALNEGQIINGYNILDFDFTILGHELGIKNMSEKYLPVIVDPMQHIYKQLGFRVKLQDIASLNFNESKIMDGKDAPMEWRKGNHKKVIDYCKKDVELEYKLYAKGKQDGSLLYKSKFSNQPQKIKVTW